MKHQSMIWWESLSINTKINCKKEFSKLVGFYWGDLSELFQLNELIHLLYNKLKKEGFEV